MEQKKSLLDRVVFPLRKKKILWRLILLYAVICVLPILLFGTVYQALYTRELKNKTSENTCQLLSMLTDRHNDLVDRLVDISIKISTYDPVQRLLLEETQLSSYEKNILSQEIGDEIEKNLLISPMVKSVVLTDASGGILYSMGYESFTAESLEQALKKAEETWPLECVTALQNSDMVLVHAVSRADYTGGHLGYLVLLIDERLFAQNTYRQLYSQEQGEICLLGDDGIVVSSYDPRLPVGQTVPELGLLETIRQAYGQPTPYFTFELEGELYHGSFFYNSKTRWYAVSLVRDSYLMKDMARFHQLIRLLSLLCILFGCLGLVIVSASIVRPVTRLVQYCKGVAERSGPRSIADNGGDELGYLTREVSNMVRTIDEYNAKDIQNSIDRKNLEIQMLQAQINPHFLFNTLNSIKWIAVLSRVPTVADSLAALAGLLKNTIVNKGEQIPLREELENVRNYALIQSLRYTERFQMEYHIQPACEERSVLKFLLQPIVENAIIYGVEGVDHVVVVQVTAALEPGGMRLEIRDDGAGFDVQTLQQPDARKKRLSGIGMANVRQRLQLAYGARAWMQVQSAPGQGTTVTMWLPDQEEKDNVQSVDRG